MFGDENSRNYYPSLMHSGSRLFNALELRLFRYTAVLFFSRRIHRVGDHYLM